MQKNEAKYINQKEIKGYLKDNFKDSKEKVLIAGNKVYFSLIDFKELSNDRIIFIAPNVL